MGRRDGRGCGQVAESAPRSSVYRLLILSFLVFVLKQKNGMVDLSLERSLWGWPGR